MSVLWSLSAPPHVCPNRSFCCWQPCAEWCRHPFPAKEYFQNLLGPGFQPPPAHTSTWCPQAVSPLRKENGNFAVLQLSEFFKRAKAFSILKDSSYQHWPQQHSCLVAQRPSSCSDAVGCVPRHRQAPGRQGGCCKGRGRDRSCRFLGRTENVLSGETAKQMGTCCRQSCLVRLKHEHLAFIEESQCTAGHTR